MAKVTMPQLGESVAEGTIGKWLKQPGDTVEKYEPLLEVITDKVNAEVPSPFAGVLKEILVEEGATVPNNAEIAVIETADEGGGAAADRAPRRRPRPRPRRRPPRRRRARGRRRRARAGATAARVPANGPAGSDERPERAAASAATAAPDGRRADRDGPGNADARMTPAVRRLLREHGLTAAQIVGTGGGGRITREDVTNYVETQRTGQPVGGQAVTRRARPRPRPPRRPAAPAAAGSAARRPPRPRRRPRLRAGARAATPTPATIAVPRRRRRGPRPDDPDAQGHRGPDDPGAPGAARLRPDGGRRHPPRRPSARRPSATTRRRRASGSASSRSSSRPSPRRSSATRPSTPTGPTTGLLAKRRINIGVAVAVDDGLIVPVIRDADQLSIHGLNVAIADVADRARAGKFRVDDFGGGTFTVDNTGYLGTNLVMPILNVPEVGIVTMEAITKRPVVVATPDGDVIAIRPIMNMVLGVDHRANDGAGGAALLRDIKAWLESVGPDTPIY